MERPRYLRVARALALVSTTAAVGGWVGCQSKRQPEPTVARDPDDKAKAETDVVVSVTKPPPARSGACSAQMWVGAPLGTAGGSRETVGVPCAEGSHCGRGPSGGPSCFAGASSIEAPTPCGPIQCEYCTCVDADAGRCLCMLPTPGPLPPPTLSRRARRRPRARRAATAP